MSPIRMMLNGENVGLGPLVRRIVRLNRPGYADEILVWDLPLSEHGLNEGLDHWRTSSRHVLSNFHRRVHPFEAILVDGEPARLKNWLAEKELANMPQ